MSILPTNLPIRTKISDPTILKSAEDASVNFVFNGHEPGVFFECRYVRRYDNYFAVYLSPQGGCRQGCYMCHLTATKQTKDENADMDNLLRQADTVLNWYDSFCPKAKKVHYNFMARGETFANPLFLNSSKELFEKLGERSIQRGLSPRFLISTIMPRTLLGKSLSEIFPVITPEIYYSIYSVRDDFRKKWLPNSMPVNDALQMLKEYQEDTKKIIKLHWAFIEGENDRLEDVYQICDRVTSVGLRVDFAIIHYNSYDYSKYGKESSDEITKRNFEVIKRFMPFSKVKMLTRVGFDVKASCGMFIEKSSLQIR